MAPRRVIDTNILSFQLRDDPLWDDYQSLIGGCAVIVSFQTVGELLEGAERAKWGDGKLRKLEHALSRVLIHYPDRTTCDCWAHVRVQRRRQPISTDDAWIAATALHLNVELVTHNPVDFADIPGLTVVTAAARVDG